MQIRNVTHVRQINGMRWAVCAFVTSSLAAAALAGDNGAVTLRMKFNVGDVTNYATTMQMKMTMTLPPGAVPPGGQPTTIPLNMKMMQQQKVSRLLPDGGAEVVTTVSAQEASTNGKTTPTPDIAPITMTYDALGKVHSMTGMDANNPAGSMLSSAFNGPGAIPSLLPAGPVKPGDTWNAETHIANLASGTTHFTFVGVEQVGRYTAAHIRAVATMPLHMNMNAKGMPTAVAADAVLKMTGTMRMTTDTEFAIAEGKIVRTDVTSDTDMIMTPVNSAAGKTGMPGPTKVKQTMSMNMAIAE